MNLILQGERRILQGLQFRFISISIMKDLLCYRLLGVYVAFLCLPFAVNAQSFSGGFNFNLPAHDATAAVYLPNFSAQTIPTAFVAAHQQAQFSVNGMPLRFYGVNITSAAAFPSANGALGMAGRLKKFGFNLVRFHHIDNTWGGASLFSYGSAYDTKTINASYRDQLERFIAALKQQGIYVNMNLLVSRRFKALDFPAGNRRIEADSISDFSYWKPAALFDPYLISLQKAYANDLLTHVNPYTGLPLKDDPVMAMTEITNENSIYLHWRAGHLRPFKQGGILLHRHHKMLDSLWQVYLTTKYSTQSSLEAAWHGGGLDRQNQILNGGYEAGLTSWSKEQHSTALATSTQETNAPYAGSQAAKISISSITGTDWHIQWKQTGLSIKQDSTYRVRFTAKADVARNITVNIQQSVSPYTWYTGQSFALSTNWQTYEFTFTAPTTNTGQVWLSFVLGQAAGNVWFDEVKFVRPGLKGIEAGEALSTGNIKRIAFGEVASYSEGRIGDLSNFYIDLQKGYCTQMSAYLKTTIGVQVPISCTNWAFGLPDLEIQSVADYQDNHSYWDHPTFPGLAWDAANWYIDNQPMVTSSWGGVVGAFGGGRAMSDKPFTISEYMHVFPNRYQTEGMLFGTAFSALHGVDGLMFFEYGDEATTDHIPGYFAIHRNPSMMALVPSLALAYRNGYIAPSATPAQVAYTADEVRLEARAANPSNPYGFTAKFDAARSRRSNISVQSFNHPTGFSSATLPAWTTNPHTSDTEELVWNTNGLFTVKTNKFIGLTGYLQNFNNHEAKDLKLVSGSDFGTLTWVSISGEDLKQASKSLITLSSVAQNTNMTWSGTNTVNNNWGSAPTLVKPLQVTLGLSINAAKIRIYPLDPSGLASTYTEYLPVSAGQFQLTLDQTIPAATSKTDASNQTLWYGLEALGLTTSLPISLLGFQGEALNGQVIFKWQTASEVNTDRFELQEKQGETWKTHATISAMGHSSVVQTYQTKLTNLASGWHTFRLATMDRDASATYTTPLRLLVPLSHAHEVSAPYPHPAQTQAQFELVVSRSQNIQVLLFNALGQQVKPALKTHLEAHERQTILLDLKGLASGLYVYKIIGETFSSSQRILVIQTP